MRRLSTFLAFLLFLSAPAFAQKTYRITGKVTSSKLEPLPFVSIQVRQLQAGNITREDGTYTLTLSEGTYDLMVSMVGYKEQTIRLTVTGDYVQNIIMEEDTSRNMEDVVIRVKIKDRSEEIIRNAIRAKDELNNASGPYSAKLYIRAVQQDSANKKDRREISPDAGLEDMAMAEISLHLDYESDNRIREERLGVKKTGNASYLYYLSATAGNFNFYNNLVRVPQVLDMPVLSPVSYSGLLAYRYKMLKIERRDGQRIYTISVKPGPLSNATVEGEITIADSSWAILHTKFRMPTYHLTNYDFFEVEQDYELVQSKAWMLARQKFTYYSKSSQRTLSGQTLVRYSDYELNKTFPRRHFGDEVSATAQQAYEQDSSFWQTVRTEPLTPKELRFIQYKDSIYRITNTEAYLDSLDRVTNKLSFKKIALTGALVYDRKKERTFLLPSVVSMIEPLGFGGVRLTPTLFYYKKFLSRKDIKVTGKLSYGFLNKDLNGMLLFSRVYNPFNRGTIALNVVRSFDPIYDQNTWIRNLTKSSYFLNNYFAAIHGLEVANGLMVYTEADYALRRNVNGYQTPESIQELLSAKKDSTPPSVPFDPYNGFYVQGTIRYTPRQRFIREPREKIILGSKWPTFFMRYFKGIPGVLDSKVDFDYLEFGVEQQFNLGLLGNTRYSIKSGDFISQRDLKLLEYSYQRRGDPWIFMNPDESFQALDSTFATFKRFYVGHLVHEFNGVFLNKIPLLKKLQLREMAGTGFLYAPERNLVYAELFAGIERVFKWPLNPLQKFKIGVYAVTSVANQFKNPVQFKVGFTTWDFIRNKWN